MDRLSTTCAERPIPEQDVQVLERVVGEMDEHLQAAPDSAGYLDRLIAEYTEELYESYERLLPSEELTESQKTRLQDIVARHGGISDYGRMSADAVSVLAEGERETLAAQMETIRRGGLLGPPAT